MVARTVARSRPYGPGFRFYHLLLLLLAFATPGLTAQARAADRLVLAFGDSLTAGYQLKPGESFPAQLEAALRRQGHAVRVVNAGVSGDTTAQGRARLGWVLAGLKAKPDLAIVALGANDMLRGQPPADARANLDAILTELGRRGIPVLLAGMLAAPNLGRDYAARFNAIHPELAKKHGVPLYPFFMQGVTPNPELLLADQLHPNRQGVAVMVRNILPAVTKALPPARAATARHAPASPVPAKSAPAANRPPAKPAAQKPSLASTAA